MADATWPLTLPTLTLLGSTEKAPKTRVLSDMDDGPPKTRSRTSRAVRPVGVSFYLQGDAEATDLMEFYEAVLDGGTKNFDGLPHPRTGSTSAVWLFAEEPLIEFVEPPELWHVQLSLWEV